MVLKILCVNKEKFMSKMKYYKEAEMMFIQEKMTIDEIATKLEVSRRILFYWKNKFQWDKKRSKLYNNNLDFSEELREFIRKLMSKITHDIDNKSPTTQAEIYSLLNLLKTMPELKNYEKSLAKSKKVKTHKTFIPNFFEKIQRDILGC